MPSSCIVLLFWVPSDDKYCQVSHLNLDEPLVEAKTQPTTIISQGVMCDRRQKAFQWVSGRRFDNELTRTCLTRALADVTVNWTYM